MGWVALGYIALLWAISYWVDRRYKTADLSTFYTARRQAHWLWVSYSMIGTTISGLTFLSLPGSVRQDGWTYLQVCIGYLIGYAAIAYILLPLYYVHTRASVYEYFRHRLGPSAEKTATLLFLLSRGIGSSLRLFLALWVIQSFLPSWPFPLLSAIALGVILLYTLRSGVAALIYTDAFQTTLFLATAAYTTYLLSQGPIQSCLSIPLIINTHPQSPHFWLKDLLGGALIAFSMTGLDQDQMQKNLSLPTLQKGQKNLLLYGSLLLPVNALFLFLGSGLWAYIACMHIAPPPPDEAFVTVVQNIGGILPFLFILGLTAAALSSADGSLTALTTVTLRNLLPTSYENIRTKNFVLIGWACLFWVLLWAYTFLPKEGHILGIFLHFSGYTYGPLLGLFLFSRLVAPGKDARYVPWGTLLCTTLAIVAEKFLGVKWGYGTILWIALWNAVGLWALSRAFRS